MEQTQELLQKWDARARCQYPRMEISGEGLTRGAGTVLAGMARDGRGRPRLGLDDEARAMALLATAYERPVDVRLLTKLRRAAELWNDGKRRSPIFISPTPACRVAAKCRPCAFSWRTNSSTPGLYPQP